ncbi:hypothetical protein HanPSC8_Chr08g0346131 [Helianthus annuus]|nr:hypothetical protein HanPSC8_Chr08g0346131 [Helianthus annuus]
MMFFTHGCRQYWLNLLSKEVVVGDLANLEGILEAAQTDEVFKCLFGRNSMYTYRESFENGLKNCNHFCDEFCDRLVSLNFQTE